MRSWNRLTPHRPPKSETKKLNGNYLLPTPAEHCPNEKLYETKTATVLIIRTKEVSPLPCHQRAGLGCSTGNSIPSARQPMPGFILMMKLSTKVQSCLSSPNKSQIEKQKLKHSFRPPVLRQTRCCRSGQKWSFIKNEKLKATKLPDAKRYF